MSEEPLPPGWSKHWSNTWKKNYWFHAKSGKQSWEPPTGSEPESSSDDVQAAGSKRGPENVSKEHESKQRKVDTQPSDPSNSSQPSKAHGADTVDSASREKQATSVPPDSSKAKKSSPEKPSKVKPAAGNLLGSLLGSIGSLESQQQNSATAELRRRRKEAEEMKRAEEKAERENYTAWVQTTLETFVEGDDPYYEFPPAQGLNRGIIQEQAEERGLVPLSVGDDKTADRRVYVFRAENAPNELERRFLTIGGGTVPELLQRRAAGDDFSKYNQVFSLKNVKSKQKARTSSKGGGDDDEDELEARVVQDRTSFNLERSAALRNKDK